MAAKEQSKALLIFLNNREVLEALEDGERGKLVLALLNYQEFGVVPDFTGAMQMAFLVLRRDVDSSVARWEAECARRSAAGKKSAAIRAAKNFRPEVSCADEFSRLEPEEGAPVLPEGPSPARQQGAALNTVEDCSAPAANTNTHSNTKSNPNTNSNSKSQSNTRSRPTSDPQAEGGASGGDREGDFARFWQAYPRKVGRQAARKAFDRVGVPVEQLLSALERQRGDPQWQREKGRFIPHPVTWLNQGRWEDEAPSPAPDCRAFGVECL